MKTYKKHIIVIFFLLFVLNISSCKRDDSTKPISQGKYNNISLVSSTSISNKTNNQSHDNQTAKQKQSEAIRLIDLTTKRYQESGEQPHQSNYLQQAMKLLSESFQKFQAKNDIENMSLNLIKLGDCKRMLTKWDEAIKFYNDGIEYAKKAAKKEHIIKALRGLVRAHMIGKINYSTALENAEEGILLSNQIGSKADLVFFLDMKSENLRYMGDLKGALYYNDQVLEMSKAISDTLSELFGYYNRAGIFFDLSLECDYKNNFDVCKKAVTEALESYKKAEELAKSRGLSGLVQAIQREIKLTEARQEEIDVLEQTYTLKEEDFRVKNVKDLQKFLTNSYLLRSTPESEDMKSKFSSILDRISFKDELVNSYYNIDDARSFFIKGNELEVKLKPDEALVEYLKAVERLEEERGLLNDGEARGTYLEDKINFYYYPISILLHQGKFEKAFELMELSKSRALSDLLSTKELNISNEGDRKLFSALIEIKMKIAAFQNDLIKLQREQSKRDLTVEISTKKQEIEKLESNYQNILNQIRSKNKNLFELVAQKPIALADLQPQLGPECEIIEYLTTEERTLIWHISNKKVTVVPVFLPRSILAIKAEKLNDDLKNYHDKFKKDNATELFLFLIRPILDKIQANHLIIIPHEELFYIPFQTLYDPEKKQYLGERFQISYLPSATLLSKLQKTSIHGNLLASANPTISDGVEEVKRVSLLFEPQQKKIFLGDFISETQLKNNAPWADIIHISTHGQFNLENPLFSSIELKRTTGTDGKLTAAEIFGITLKPSSIVTLSACETGRGKASHANEVIGLSRAFIYAGADALVLTNWKVEANSTALWMEIFYQEGMKVSLAEAARKALIKVKSDPRYEHPYYWGPFFIIGR